jgi:WD40 repeat protein
MTLHKMITAHERAVVAICWSPKNNNLLASCSMNSQVTIWDIESEEAKFSTKLDAPPLAMDWASAGDQLAFVLDNGDVKLWNYAAGTQSKLFSIAPKDSAKVLRWHPHVLTRLLVGDTVGSLHIYDLVNAKATKILGKAKTSKDPVTDAQWDPLSEIYLLAAFQDGSLILYDASTQQELHTFDKQAQSIKSMAWARAQPGNFLTASDRAGVLRLWNVSQKTPLGQIKVGNSGINCIKEIPGQPHWFVVSFKSSSVGICDISARMMKFMSTPGHSETIFDVVFHPYDQDLLATASFDGYVKFWRTSTMENVREMYAGSNQVLYGLALGPGATRVCAVSGTGCLFVWRVDTGEQLHRLQLHSEKQAYRCDWKVQAADPDGGGMIITGGADGTACIVDALSGSMTRRITHPAAVVGVTWHPLLENVLATGCQDGGVRIFRNRTDSNGAGDLRPEVLLTGHDARVFNIALHPVIPGIIASGSDDKTIRVWRWQQDGSGPRELRRLVGHTNFVRGLLWHSELPGILFSGSWDSTIRTWDVASQRCLHISNEHYADVYGLALHPQRPFFLGEQQPRHDAAVLDLRA